jgi:CheY-like chemotaxis protein
MTTLNILLIEDNPADVRLIKEALKEGNLPASLQSVKDGKEALDYLLQLPPFESAILPDIIILDLNLPRMNGREVLSKIKSMTHLSQIPVIILTTSSSPSDIDDTYQNNANCYITKPFDFSELVDTILLLKNIYKLAE